MNHDDGWAVLETIEPAIRQPGRRWKIVITELHGRPEPGDCVITNDDDVLGLWTVPGW